VAGDVLSLCLAKSCQLFAKSCQFLPTFGNFAIPRIDAADEARKSFKKGGDVCVELAGFVRCWKITKLNGGEGLGIDVMGGNLFYWCSAIR
jgi:hypothetical protein